MKPTVGRVVLYHPKPGVIHAALIAYVHSDTMVNLAAFDNNGNPYGQTSVELVAPDAPSTPEFGSYCQWMPFQVQQAKKQEHQAIESVTDAALEASILSKGLTAARITPDHIAACMARVTYVVDDRVNGSTTTLAHAFLDGSFYLGTGMSACVSVDNYDADIGRSFALKNATKKAEDKLWELEGYALRAKLLSA